MSLKFDQAKEYAINQIKAGIETKVLTSIGDSATRSVVLGIHDKNFDWRAMLDKSTSKYDAFDSLKRYCAQLIRQERPLLEELRLWLTGYLDDFYKTPRRAKGAPRAGRQHNMFLPQLVHRISIDFGLSPTRNAVSEPLSGCNAASEAINSFQPSERLRPSSCDAFAKAYTNAKNLGAIVS